MRAKKKKTQRQIIRGAAHIQATYNNTIVSFADAQGNVVSWSSAGKIGFKGPKKSTPYAASLVVRDAATVAREQYGMKEVDIFVQGIGPGRDSAVRAVSGNGLVVHIIKDMTPVPHNGCRPPKVRRV
ncbi:MAG: 30S ribosomal protein S11 [bacterium]|nr:30S ribosomal protein S11 [bacterium]